VVRPRVSIILVNYNGMPHVEVCLASISRQMFKEFETILVDNSSTDESVAYVRERFPDVQIILNNSNLGYAGGINSALSPAQGEYIAPLNMDTEVEPDWLGRLVNYLDENKQVGAVTPRIMLYDHRDRVNTMGLDIHVSGLAFCRNLGKEGKLFSRAETVSGISGCSYLVRAEILKKMGGLPEECFMANDDVILSWLAIMMGYELGCEPDSVIYHKYHPALSAEKIHNLEGNRHRLLLYTLRKRTLLLLSPVLFAVELMVMAYCILKGTSYIKAKVSTYSELWKDRSQIKKRKEEYSSLRKIGDLAIVAKLKWNLSFSALNYKMQDNE
jgi:GT2 family glycosyltransferase